MPLVFCIMYWADYRKGAEKAKAHVGFNLNCSIPSKIFLIDGKGDECPFVSQILSAGQTGIMDRYYQCHRNFDQWQQEGTHFVCRSRNKTKKTVIRANEVTPGNIVFYDAVVLLGTPRVNQADNQLRVIGYRVDCINHWIDTDRYGLNPKQISMVYTLRWNIETFFLWWKQHLKVYHLIASNRYGFMVQMLAGLINYILLAIYCYMGFGEKVSIKRVRKLRITIIHETRAMGKIY